MILLILITQLTTSVVEKRKALYIHDLVTKIRHCEEE